MFILHSSNKTENLLEHLAIILKTPLTSPFAEELFLIQSQGMERWLSQQLAEHFNVWGNFRYLFPGKFFSRLSEQLHTGYNDAAFDRHLLLWRFEALLRNLEDDAFKPLRHYLSGENIDLKRYQLARQLMRIFDQYQMLRPDLLNAWQQGGELYQTESERWQRRLWLNLTAEIGGLHRGEVWRQIIGRLQQSSHEELAGILPERISVFGINSVPPLLLAYLQALSAHCDVHFYLLNPVQSYWADLPGKKLLTQLAEFEGHPLLISLGQQGREFQQMLLEQVEFHFEPSSFEAQSADNNLRRLQNDILHNIIPCLKLPADNSISIHACHSRLREVQALKAQLLDTLENNPGLELRDIVVMAPDIQLYAAYVSAVFSDIQHSIADRSLRISNAALNALLRFLALSQGRLGWQSVLDLLEQPAVFPGFGLDEADMELIRHWIADTRVRWGRSAAHKQALDLPPLNQNTWQAALERLFMGYAVGGDTEFVDGVLPYLDIEGASSQALGGLNDFLQLLFKAGDELQTPKPLEDWQNLLSRYADKLLGKADPQERQALYELLAEMTEIAAIHSQLVSLDVVIAWLDGQMDESKSSNGFLRGQLTFCSMLPMRSIPFQVIALLGMNNGEFPKIERNPSFDLLSQHWRLGDRSRRADDRYQFLEILLSARRQLIITYTGQSLRDNSEIPPSVIVSELLDVLRNCYGQDNLLTRHPLHAFSPRYFDGDDTRLFSFAQGDYATACRLGAMKAAASPWWQGGIEIEPGQPIALDELRLFFNHPQRFFLRRQLGIDLPQIGAEADEREPFTLDNLDRYCIQQLWVDKILNGDTLTLARLQAQGLWPAGCMGELEWLRQEPAIRQFADGIKAKGLGEAKPPQALDLQLGDFRLSGKLEHLYANGSLLFRYSNLKGRDFIAAWLQHLLANCLEPQTTHLVCKDKYLRFPPQLADQGILLELLETFIRGQQYPDVFFTEAAFYFLQQKNSETALNAVVKHVMESVENGYEPEIGQLLANRDLNGIFDDGFARQCQTLLYPAWSAGHGD